MDRRDHRPTDGTATLAAVHGGFISINDDHVKILSDLAELADGIDVDRAQAAAERAEARPCGASDDAEADRPPWPGPTPACRATGVLV